MWFCNEFMSVAEQVYDKHAVEDWSNKKNYTFNTDQKFWKQEKF